MSSQRGKNQKSGPRDEVESLMFLPRCDVLCASITEQTKGKWKLFVLYNKYMKKYISKHLLNFPGEFSGR